MNISEYGFVTVGAIAVICYVAGHFWKLSAFDDKWIPIVVGVLGGILGIAGFYVIPDYPATDILNAIAVGIVSGAGSTWANQLYKQLKGE